MGRLDGKVAAITGGASGIGEATVRRFVAEGASVAFCDRDGERGRRVAAELEAAGGRVAFTQADVGTEAACLAFVNEAAEKFGRLDILVNNAGGNRSIDFSCNRDREAGVTVEVVGRAVDRIDDPPHAAGSRSVSSFFAENGIVGTSFREESEDQRL